jgi:DNA-binding IclR family transcriptional regulator
MLADQRDIIKSVGRVFEVLELFDESRRPMTSGEVARALQYPPSSTITLLKSMVRLGYISFNQVEFTYLPTMRLVLTADWVRDLDNGDQDILQLMDDISQSTRETVTLTCENDGEMQILRVLPGRHPIGLYEVGARVPMFTSTVGLTALSQRSDLEIVRIAQKLNQRPQSLRLNIDLPAVLQKVNRVRANGYGIDEYRHLNHEVLAWAIPSKIDKFPYIISLRGDTERIEASKENLVSTVRSAIRPRLSQRNAFAP